MSTSEVMTVSTPRALPPLDRRPPAREERFTFALG